MFTKIQSLNVIEVKHEFNTDGHQPLLVIAEDFQMYVAKSGKGQYPPFTILSEFICSFLLSCWEIPTPHPVLLSFSQSVLNKPLSSTNKPGYYLEYCFGSKMIPEAIEANDLANSKASWQFSKIGNPMDLIWIGLFDVWVENDDRKPTNPNLLFKENPETMVLEVIAIDHAYTFSTLDYQNLNPEWVMQADNDSILRADFVRPAIKKLLKSKDKGPGFSKLKDSFQTKVLLCKENIDLFLSELPSEMGLSEDLAGHLKDFLFDEKRNLLVFEDFLTKLH